MNNNPKMITDPLQYGNKGQEWNEVFVDYMASIVSNLAYTNMPDAIKDDGKIQWEAPSNRKGGKYKDTHHKRRSWWKEKATAMGIDINQDKWISRTAKLIHPTGNKPCKRCGRVMQIAYIYPSSMLIKRIQKEFPEYEVNKLSTIPEVLDGIHGIYPNATGKFRKLLKTAQPPVPELGNDIESWKEWVISIYSAHEPKTASPGAMSNAPDRFEGFHSFNLCCRNKADRGRHDSNMLSYNTDRRVFEHWSDGNWIAADKLMGIIASKYRNEPTFDGGSPPATADHIGPLSLGFCHRPEFRLLSKSANSSKNNRMSLLDINDLIKAESDDHTIISWHSAPLWNLAHKQITTEEEALRLSKLLRDHQRNAMHILAKLMEAGHYSFLTSLLGLNYADYTVEFINLKIEDFLTKFDSISLTKKTTKYSSEQKSRRIRIGFQALKEYKKKDNRHSSIIENDTTKMHYENAINLLNNLPPELVSLSEQLHSIFKEENESSIDSSLRILAKDLTELRQEQFTQVKQELINLFTEIAHEIHKLWDNERYTRMDVNLKE